MCDDVNIETKPKNTNTKQCVRETEKSRIPIFLQAGYITHYITSDIYQTLLY